MNQERITVKIIGLGGIGSILSEHLCRFLNFQRNIISNVILIDGDSYEEKNLERQVFQRLGNKAEIKKTELTYRFDRIDFSACPEFINSDTIKNIINNGDIIFLAVDNHKTRKIVSDYVSTLNDIVLFSGGNELTDGNVQLYLKKGGIDLTPKLTTYHPEIENPQDKLPEELSCQELEESSPQLLFTNLTVATLLCQMFYNYLNGNFKFSEVYFDILNMCSDSKIRQIV